jgi:rod shape-determining protein MreD
MFSANSMNQNKLRDPLWIIVLSLVIGSILMVYPLSYSLAGWRPVIMLMITLFWVLLQPTWCGIWFSFAVGLFTDLLLDAPLGLHALSFVMLTFSIRWFIRERRLMTFGNTWVIVSLAVLAHLLYILFAQIISDMQFSITRHWQPLMSSILTWPVLYYLLKKWRI